jgi:hypothetical protein
MYPPPPGYGQQPMQPMGYGAPYYPAPTEQGSGMAVAGLILGIIAIPSASIAGCGFVIGVLGLIFSILGRKSFSRRTMATVGIVLSSIALALAVANGIVGAINALNAIPH